MLEPDLPRVPDLDSEGKSEEEGRPMSVRVLAELPKLVFPSIGVEALEGFGRRLSLKLASLSFLVNAVFKGSCSLCVLAVGLDLLW